MNAITRIEEEVPIYDIAPRSRGVIDGIEYIYETRLDAGHKFARVDDMRIFEIFTHSHLHRLIRTDAIRIDEGFFSSVKAQLRLSCGRKTFGDLTKPQAQKIILKKRWCDKYIALEHVDRHVRRSDAKLEKAIVRIAAEMKSEIEAAEQRRRLEMNQKKKRGASKVEGSLSCPSPDQLRRWVKRYERGGYEVDALIDQYNGPGKSRQTLCSESYSRHQEFATRYASSTRPSKASLFTDLEIALDDEDSKRLADDKPPLRRLKRRAFEKMIEQLDPFFVTLGREGREAALLKWGIVTTGLDVEKPFERLEMDEWNVSLMRIMVDAGVWELLEEKQRKAVERKRVWLSAVIDARTRMIVAMRFLEGSPCTESALSAIELAMTDKSRIVEHFGTSPTYLHAKPRAIAMDNGVNFANGDVVSRLVTLNINPVFPPAGLSQMRARIERVFGTLKTRIASFFTGQTFSNIIEKGDYDAQANASINIEELNRVFIVGVLDLYHHHPHEGLNGETPFNCMRRLSRQYGLPLPPDRNVMRHVMGVSTERRIGGEGIRFLGIRYQSKALQILRRDARQKPVEIRVDRFDLSRISVKTGNGGWIVCNARFQGLKDVSIWRWSEAVRDLRQHNADVSALSHHHVLNAVRELSSVAAEAVKRSETMNPVVTSKTFDWLEEKLFRTLTFADDGLFGEDMELPAELEAQAASADASHADETAMKSAIPIDHHDELDTDEDGFGSPDDWSSN